MVETCLEPAVAVVVTVAAAAADCKMTRWTSHPPACKSILRRDEELRLTRRR